MISPKTYYYLAMLLPLALPGFFYLINAEKLTIAILYVPLLYAGPQYLIFVIFCYYYFRHKTAAEISRKVMLAPLLFIGFALVGAFLGLFVSSRIGEPNRYFGFDDIPFLFFFYGIFGCIYGYAYVYLAIILEWILIRCKIITRADAS